MSAAHEQFVFISFEVYSATYKQVTCVYRLLDNNSSVGIVPVLYFIKILKKEYSNVEVVVLLKTYYYLV